ncbi:MAG TPA: sodium:proton antiporter [Candidatus Binatia bacterium]
MELPLALAIGLMFAGAVYSFLRPNLIRMVVGFGLLSNATNLLMIAAGGFRLDGLAPFVWDADETTGLMDPLPPDIVLTAIVISFAVSALFITISYAVYRDYGTDDPESLPRPEADDESYHPRPARRPGYDE